MNNPPPCQFSPAPSPRTPKRKLPLHSDGFAWVKYGEKRLSPSGLLREYYKCRNWRPSHSGGTGCTAKKVVDRPYSDIFTDDGLRKNQAKESLALIFFKDSTEAHNHPPPSVADLSSSAPPTPAGRHARPSGYNFGFEELNCRPPPFSSSSCLPSPVTSPPGLPPRPPPSPSVRCGQSSSEVGAVTELLVQSLLAGSQFMSEGQKTEAQDKLRLALTLASEDLQSQRNAQHVVAEPPTPREQQQHQQLRWIVQDLHTQGSPFSGGNDSCGENISSGSLQQQQQLQHELQPGSNLSPCSVSPLTGSQESGESVSALQSPALPSSNGARFKPALPPLMIPESSLNGPESVHDLVKPETQFEESQEALDCFGACDFLFDLDDLGSASKPVKSEDGGNSSESMAENCSGADQTVSAADVSPCGPVKRKECESPMEHDSRNRRASRLFESLNSVQLPEQQLSGADHAPSSKLLGLLEGLIRRSQSTPATPAVQDRPVAVSPTQSQIIGALTTLLTSKAPAPAPKSPEPAIINLISALCDRTGSQLQQQQQYSADMEVESTPTRSHGLSNFFSGASQMRQAWQGQGTPRARMNDGAEPSAKLQNLLRSLSSGSSASAELLSSLSNSRAFEGAFNPCRSDSEGSSDLMGFQVPMRQSANQDSTLTEVLSAVMAAAGGAKPGPQNLDGNKSAQQVLLSALLLSLSK